MSEQAQELTPEDVSRVLCFAVLLYYLAGAGRAASERARELIAQADADPDAHADLFPEIARMLRLAEFGLACEGALSGR